MSYKSVRLNLKILSLSFHLLSFLFIKLYALNHLQDHTERYQSTPPLPFPGEFFFLRKIGKHKIFTCEQHDRP